jgi:hypothetical protein
VIRQVCASGYLKRESIHEGLISAWDTIATLNSGARLNRPGRTAGSSRPLVAGDPGGRIAEVIQEHGAGRCLARVIPYLFMDRCLDKTRGR